MSSRFAPVTDPNLRVTGLGTVHFIGLGGAGMSVIARMLHSAGVRVQGSDQASGEVTESLQELGITVFEGHAAEQVAGADTVVVSSAVREENPELTFARTHGLRVLHRSQALALLMRDRRAIAVAGAHGKTSTSAMIAVGALELGLDPSFAIGGSVITSAGPIAGGRLGSSDVVIAEADESDGSFLNYEPMIAVVTNVEPDHLDHYGSAAAFAQAFVDFAGHITPAGTLVACGDDPGARAVATAHRDAGGAVLTYGENPENDLVVSGLVQAQGSVGITATVTLGPRVTATSSHAVTLNLAVPGVHNVLNATAALATLILLGSDPAAAAGALGHFLGTGRRFESRGEAAGVHVVDDYAHHPTEVTALLKAARVAAGSGRVLTLFQPHLFSRTKTFVNEFADALSASDVTVLSRIYAAREDFDPTIASTDVAARMTGRVLVVDDLDQAAATIADLARPGDLVLTVGAGDVTRVGPDIVAALVARSMHQEVPKQ